jgi:YcaO-like protein with predicted kinase domain
LSIRPAITESAGSDRHIKMAPVTAIAEYLDEISEIDFFETPQREIQDADIDKLVEQIGITRIAWTTQLDRLCTPTLYCVRPTALHACAIYSSGKAFDPRRALLSSVFESYERWAAERPTFSVEASADDLVEYARGRDLTIFESPGVEPAMRIRWALGRNVATAGFAAAPACYVEFPPIAPGDQKFTTTGLASHGGFADATQNALLECIERHHTSALAPSTISRVAAVSFSMEAARLAETFARENIELHTFVIDNGSPFRTAYCYAYDHWLGVPQIHCSGFGASTCLKTAVDKAMLEVVQSRAAMISGLRADVSASAFRWRHDYRQNSEHLAWLEKLRSVERLFNADSAAPDSADTLGSVLGSMTACNFTPLIFPLRTAAGFPAVRAFVPELNDCC